MFKFMLMSVVSGEVKNEVIRSGEVKAEWTLEFRDLGPRMLGLAFVLDRSVKTRPALRVAVVEGSLGETAFSFPAGFFFFFSGVSVGGGFRGPTGFFTLPSEGIRTREFSLRVLGLDTRDSLGAEFSLPEVGRTLTVFVLTGDRAVREGIVALLFATCSGVVEPLIGSRGTNTGGFTADLLVDDSGVLRTIKYY